MEIFETFRMSRQAVPLCFPQKIDQFRADHGRLRFVRCEADAASLEPVADRQLDLCEQLLWKASPADESLLRRCGVDIEGLRRNLDAVDARQVLILLDSGTALKRRIEELGSGQPVLAVESGLSNRFLIEIERLILTKFTPLLAEAYAQAVFIKVTALCVRANDAIERDGQIQVLQQRYRFILRKLDLPNELEELDRQLAELDEHLKS